MKEKKERKIKIRITVRQMYFLILLIIMVSSLFVLYTSYNSVNKNDFVKTNIYEYNNKYSYSCDVTMLENEYIAKENVPDQNVYVTELMDSANINMIYNYDANKESNLEYSYKVIGTLEATYSKDGDEQKVWKKTDVIVPAKQETVTSDKIEINENFLVDLKDKIKMIKDFQEKFGLQVETKYTVSLEVSSKTSIMNQDVINVYSPNVVFDITSKTTTVKTTTEDSAKPQVVTKMIKENDPYKEVRNSVATVMFILSAIFMGLLLVKTQNSNIVRNTYKVELNRILKDCEEKIVEVNKKVDITGQGVVDVKDFEEIIKISEELFKPILYWNNEKEEESWFCVLGNNMVYRFILKR